MDIKSIELLVNKVTQAAKVIGELKQNQQNLLGQIDNLKSEKEMLEKKIGLLNQDVLNYKLKLEKSVQFDQTIENKIIEALTYLDSSIEKPLENLILTQQLNPENNNNSQKNLNIDNKKPDTVQNSPQSINSIEILNSELSNSELFNSTKTTNSIVKDNTIKTGNTVEQKKGESIQTKLNNTAEAPVNEIFQTSVKKPDTTQNKKDNEHKSNEMSEEEIRIKKFLSMDDEPIENKEHEHIDKTDAPIDLFSAGIKSKDLHKIEKPVDKFIETKITTNEIEFGRNIPKIEIENEEFANDYSGNKETEALLLDDGVEPDEIDFEIIDDERKNDEDLPRGVL